MDRIVESHHLEERYFERMNSSLGDKTKLLRYLPAITDPENPPRILDVGAGSGSFSNALSELGYDVTALDASDDAVMHIRRTYPHITTAHYLANQVGFIGENLFDVVICSSILHEVYSYGDNYHRAGHISSLGRALDAFVQVLKPAGLLLIRDGVLPENWKSPATVQLLGDIPTDVVHKYLEMCPFANGRAYNEQGTTIALTEGDGKVFSGNVRSVLEFAYTYTWGVDSYPRETQEMYAVMTLKDYQGYLRQHGFSVLEAFSYLQPGYPEHLAGVLDLKVDGEPAEWFDSNAIWVGRVNK